MSSRLHHLRPSKRQRQARRTTTLFVVILFVLLFVLAIALAATGRGVPAGRILP
jgi:Na+/proline symporter